MIGASVTVGYPSVGTAALGFRNMAAAIADPNSDWTYIGASSSGVWPVLNYRAVNGWRVIDHLAEVSTWGTGAGQYAPTLIVVDNTWENDCVNGTDYANLQTNYTTWITALHTQLPAARFVLCTAPHYNSDATVESRRVAFIALLNSTVWPALRTAGVKFVTCDLDVLTPGTGDYTTTPDTNHPTYPVGHQKLANVIGPAMAAASLL